MINQKLLGRYTKTFPITLFRLQPGYDVKLREFFRQQAKNLPSYDFKIMKDGLIHPMTTDEFIQPNGISGKCIYIIKEGVQLPENLVLLHEHTDHYSLQTTIACKEEDLNKRLTRFLKENGSLLSKDQLLKLIKENKMQQIKK
ncbi:unnamed protein product [Brachionus calyciflorus]|uniref:Tse2 ADP-ribosyltransferase toxin domain-containing protein n=1 Tax=Brachionus calyciflorus TaxID=104777 RepID=A0A813RGR5_9BILA|nr:unnamed protein product [Brachionus calyciflorus]